MIDFNTPRLSSFEKRSNVDLGGRFEVRKFLFARFGVDITENRLSKVIETILVSTLQRLVH